MGVFVIKVPDVGEGIAEAELAEWGVSVGDIIREDQVFAAVMTDKATVEIPSSVEGKVIWLGGELGDAIAIGADLIRIEVEGEGNEGNATKSDDVDDPAVKIPNDVEEVANPTPTIGATVCLPRSTAEGVPKAETHKRKEGEKPLASPSVRQRAKDSGIDLRLVCGNGPAGVITHGDLDAYFESDGEPPTSKGRVARTSVKEVKIIGLRRKIAERMSLAKSRIPHITIVEEIDVTALEDLRAHLNLEKTADKSKLTILPFLIGAMVKALGEQPSLNAQFDDEAGVVREFGAIHVGIAVQTPNGLMVPVVRHCEARSIWDTAAEVARVSGAAKSGSANREELSGSTITITSLGALGAIATTPIINHPEVSIVGVNRIAIRPMWNGTEFVPKKMMNISSSFDHRVVDGWDAAVFVKRLKTLLETPAMIFVED